MRRPWKEIRSQLEKQLYKCNGGVHVLLAFPKENVATCLNCDLAKHPPKSSLSTSGLESGNEFDLLSQDPEMMARSLAPEMNLLGIK